MQIRKAVITAAGRGLRLYPAADTVQKAMLPLVDRDGFAKPVCQIIAEEALESGIEELCIVCAPGDDARYLTQFRMVRDNLLQTFRGMEWARQQAERVDAMLRRLTFAVQEEPLGYGHAVGCARRFVGDEPFLLLLGDHLYISNVAGQRCAQQLMQLALQEECPVAAVHATREHLVQNYGTLTGKRWPGRPGVYQIEKILEKPSLSHAELELQTPGLRAGFYLCFFGMHVLTPQLFEVLDEEQARAPRTGLLQLTPALLALAQRGKYLALEVNGTRHDIGTKLGLLEAQLALGLAGSLRDQVLTTVVESLAEDRRRRETT